MKLSCKVLQQTYPACLLYVESTAIDGKTMAWKVEPVGVNRSENYGLVHRSIMLKSLKIVYARKPQLEIYLKPESMQASDLDQQQARTGGGPFFCHKFSDKLSI